ncbi:MAG: DUF6447 family protein [Thiomicrospira sp.]
MTEKKTTARKTTPKPAASSKGPTLTIDGQPYLVEALSTAAKAQIRNIQLTDGRIEQLQVELAIAQTARNAYVRALSEQLATEPNAKA